MNNAIILALDENKLSNMISSQNNVKTINSIKFYPSAKQMKSSTARGW